MVVKYNGSVTSTTSTDLHQFTGILESVCPCLTTPAALCVIMKQLDSPNRTRNTSSSRPSPLSTYSTIRTRCSGAPDLGQYRLDGSSFELRQEFWHGGPGPLGLPTDGDGASDVLQDKGPGLSTALLYSEELLAPMTGPTYLDSRGRG
ncbi:hypothetical protein O1611_g7752 [Lasiodiplodia mahajangana]|uniref:Uncharacterized protein n=1 Tax=Lasiodiplodia mahajangana TaxID=1108764 RepID=A0ACC2JEC6_9PEZI|nr:hypothetical protein O1611_g7752 [Lasiodiplodia mahajangana]